MDFSTYVTGLTMGLTLIVAIGAQNAFVLRQGLRGEHVAAVVLTCAVSDAILITVGVTAFRQIAAILPALEPAMRYAGAAFLFWYGAKSLKSALGPANALVAASGTAASLGSILATCLALTWLNPHVYLDTVVLLGTISTQFPGSETSFWAGAVTASFLFFFSLGYGARWLRPIFANPQSWRVLEGVIALTMWLIAIKLLTDG
ncbi:L-lysine exporter family protein LysE/ArgO [Rhizobium skierniewicense]|uniref:L-lysine exporter family protein LysE/ArgO n=1 Tax=Rhizobium skierniewicense TaxID=984260 RepID=A0A7W6G300_9HYPH|nr:LysE/ArgO family amino acid transporter [Rhizobium skierniewicense]MBB3947332.1 L-lysine exporter family protein LysE/ArgO [Rhizobium skierniewicense]